jgi:hypothetical protein
VALGGEEVEELLADFGAFHKLAALNGIEFESRDFKRKTRRRAGFIGGNKRSTPAQQKDQSSGC